LGLIIIIITDAFKKAGIKELSTSLPHPIPIILERCLTFGGARGILV
jgi:hypothetical protein